MDNQLLCIADDLTLYEDSMLGKHKYFMSSECKEKYLKISKEQYQVLSVVLPYFDGTRTKNEIEIAISKEKGIDLCLDKIIAFFKQYGLLEGSDKDGISKVEMDLYAKKVWIFDMLSLQSKHKHFFTFLYKLIMWLSLFGFLTCIILFYLDGSNFIDLLTKRKLTFDWKKVKISEFIFIIIFSYISVFIHEMGHILSATYYGIPIKSFTFILKYGIIPAFYVKYRNLYTAKSNLKVKILFSGVYFNIIQIITFTILYYFTVNWVFMILIILNFNAIVSNLSPLTTSDGYHIFTTVFNLEGFRWNILKHISLLLNNKIKLKELFTRNSIKYMTYFLFSLYLTFQLFYQIVVGTLRFLNFNFVDNNWISSIAITFICFNIIFYIFYFCRKVRKIS